MWSSVWESLIDQSGLGADSFVQFVGDFEMVFGMRVDDPIVRPDGRTANVEVAHLAQTLQDLVRDQAQPVQLSRQQLFDRLGWSERLRFRHPHHFPVPASYTANEVAREALESLVDNGDGGYVSLLGPAGSGKSTLLASMRFDGRTAKYYAFVPDAPDPLSSRGEADSFLHDITLALEESGLPRRGIGNDLPSLRAVLARQLDDAGGRWSEHAIRTIIVIDGLDHIPREQNPGRSLIEELPGPSAIPSGVFLLLGTQTNELLPRPIQDAVSLENRTVVVPPLSSGEITRISEAAGLEWLFPGQLDRITEVSEGHPLALTYIIQQLTALEENILDIPARRERADWILLNELSYGGDIEAKYRGYYRSIGADPQVLDILGVVARLRVSLNLDWLSSWADPHAVSAFAAQACTFFQRAGAEWTFVHNSFRRFLADETAKVAGRVNGERDRYLNEVLADICEGSGAEWRIYEDEEIAHRFLAGQHSRVLKLVTPERLRNSLLNLRPEATVRDQAVLGLRSATASDNGSAFLMTLVFLNELHSRSVVLEADTFPDAIHRFDPRLALEHTVRGGKLRIGVDAALALAVEFSEQGDASAAQRVLQACGGLAGVLDTRSPSADAVADWAEIVWRLSGTEAVLEQLDHHLPPARTLTEPDGNDASESNFGFDEVEKAEYRHGAQARISEMLAEVRDELNLSGLIATVDDEGSPGWRARIRYICARVASEDRSPDEVLKWVREIVSIDQDNRVDTDEDNDSAFGSSVSLPHSVSLSIRLAAAELLIRNGFRNDQLVNQLVPAGTRAVWPENVYGQKGLAPYETLIALVRIRAVCPDATVPDPIPSSAWPSSNDPGTERLRRALRVVANIEGQQLAYRAGLVSVRPRVAAVSDPVVRLLEVPFEDSRDWLGWHHVQEAALGLYRRIVLLAGRSGLNGELDRQLRKFEEGWGHSERSKYWTIERQQSVLMAALDAHRDAQAWVSKEASRIDGEIKYRSYDPHDRTSSWLTQAKVWESAGDAVAARTAAQSAVQSSLGIDSSDHDRQLVEWLNWLEDAINEDVIEFAEIVQMLQKYANRIATIADISSNHAQSAAEKLIALALSQDVSLGCQLADSLCDSGAIAESDTIHVVVLNMCKRGEVPVKVGATAAAQLLYPIVREVANDIPDAVALREHEDEGVRTLLCQAERLWTVVDEPAPLIRAVGEQPKTDQAPPPIQGSLGSVESSGSLLAHMRRATNAAEHAQPEWDEAVRRSLQSSVGSAVAQALLEQAVRLGLTGLAFGSLVALAARVGKVEFAASSLAEILGRTTPYGWSRHYDGGSRQKILSAALQDHNPRLLVVARTDLVNCLAGGSLSGQFSPNEIRRIVEVVASRATVSNAWSQIEKYLDIVAPADVTLPAPRIGPKASAPLLAFAQWIATFLGHPVRLLDFGARRTLQVVRTIDSDVIDDVLSENIQIGGWAGEGALLALLVTPLSADAPPFKGQLKEAILAASVAADGINRDLANRLLTEYELGHREISPRPLPAGYRLTLPPLPDREAPEWDGHGTPHLDPNDPQDFLAPFDMPLRVLAKVTELDESAIIRRAALIAQQNDDPWIRGGHRSQAARLERRQQFHSYRPWAYMAGRRAVGIILAELDDARMLNLPPFPAYQLKLVDEQLCNLEVRELPVNLPQPWRPESVEDYDFTEWCSEVPIAAAKYMKDYSNGRPLVLAERGLWRGLEWSQPEEERFLRPTQRNLLSMFTPLEPPIWTTSFSGASNYPWNMRLNRTREELVLEGYENVSDAPHLRWLALHPAVADQLGWKHEEHSLFHWKGTDGHWRARTELVVRGQLSHRPLAHNYCAEIWRVLLSELGFEELSQAFPSLVRMLTVKRTFPESRRHERPLEFLEATVNLP